ncbi:isopentenyldiphosphate isomerase [Beggiatoa alba B18LD]|uniref:Isopentenyldiphosphate isomerase n=1 Tax=Beggiatoa alba B18LD TaxID=395493 RepID=I3CDU2_9GAMM|nr:NUDIX domain-containing protein [Beggiatoa alba]EIJ41785.1 isopentenyldiphosphate isomerase [Beggiatoa alba B18LD]
MTISSLPNAEYLDVVDTNDMVIESRLRSEIHHLGLRHRSVHILVFNPQGEIFLHKRNAQKKSFPLHWDSSAAGHVATGESYAQAAERELLEELQINAPLQALFQLEASPRTTQEFCWVYRCVTTETPKPDPDEIELGAWFTPAFVDAWIQREKLRFTPLLQMIWEKGGIS